MDENTLRQIAHQLRKPEGNNGILIGQQMNIGNKWMNELTIKCLNISSGDNILEIGMGNGAFVESILIQDDYIKYSGCDYSDVMVEEAKIINRKFVEKGQAKFYMAAADKLPFADDVIDKVFGVNVFYFWSNPSIELAEIKRVLKPGGSLTIAVRPKHIMLTIPYTQYGFRMCTKEELIKVFEGNNFKVTDLLELDEPDQEINGQTLKLVTIIIKVQK